MTLLDYPSKKRLALAVLLFAALLLHACSWFGPEQPTLTPEPTLTPTLQNTPVPTPAEIYPEPGGVPVPEPYPYPVDPMPLPTLAPTQPYPEPAVTEAEPPAPASETATATVVSSPTPTASPTDSGYPPPAATIPPPAQGYPPPASTIPPPTGGYPPPAEGYPPPGVTPVSPTQPSPIPQTATATPTLPVSGSPFPTPAPGTIFPTPTERPITTAMPPPRTELATISIWHSWSESERQTLDDVMRAFQEVYPDIYFDILYIPADQLRIRYESATYTGGGPNLIFGPADWGPSFFDQGLVKDISEIATPEFLNTINPAALSQARYQGALIGLPHTIRSGIVLYRNTSIIANAPATFGDLVSSAQAATRPGIVGAYLDRSYFYSAAHLYGIGGKLMDEAGNPLFNSVHGREWLNLLVAFRNAGPVDYNSSRDLEYFRTGRAGFIIDSTANMRMLTQNLGAQNLAIDPWPSNNSGRLSGFIKTDNIYLNANLTAEEHYTPLLFMGFMLSPEVQNVLTRAGHIPVVPATKVDDVLMRQALDAFDGATAYPIAPGTAIYWDALDTAMQSVFAQRETPRNALMQAHRIVLAAIADLRNR